jgi:hypothetical protein
MQEDRPINDEEFSLRDKDNLTLLENIVDDLLDISERDKKEFFTTYKNLPLYIYNKIDDLRNVSFDKKGEDFKRVAIKAKKVNTLFHKKFK